MIRLSHPPSTNNLYANVGGKGRIKTYRYRAWCHGEGWRLKAQPRQSVTGPYFIEIVVERPKRKRDIDGFIKGVLDLLVDIRHTSDDSHCQGVEIYWADAIPDAPTVAVRLCNDP